MHDGDDYDGITSNHGSGRVDVLMVTIPYVQQGRRQRMEPLAQKCVQKTPDMAENATPVLDTEDDSVLNRTPACPKTSTPMPSAHGHYAGLA